LVGLVLSFLSVKIDLSSRSRRFPLPVLPPKAFGTKFGIQTSPNFRRVFRDRSRRTENHRVTTRRLACGGRSSRRSRRVSQPACSIELPASRRLRISALFTVASIKLSPSRSTGDPRSQPGLAIRPSRLLHVYQCRSL
jgi:hypothetical protein